MSMEYDLGFIGSFHENNPKQQLTEEQKVRQSMLDELIKQNFQWHLGKNTKTGTTDLSKGTGLAILARVVGVDEIEHELRPFIDRLKEAQNAASLDERLSKLEDLSEEIGMLDRKLELEVTKKYQTSRKTIYGVENELHLVEQIQKALSMIYYNTENSDIRNSIVITLEKLIKRNELKMHNLDDSNPGHEVEPHEKELELSEQIHLVLKLAMNLKSIS